VRILVSGGAGYPGWPTVSQLSAAGHHVGMANHLAGRPDDVGTGVESPLPIGPMTERLNSRGENPSGPGESDRHPAIPAPTDDGPVARPGRMGRYSPGC
jgi:hypothetical protein